MDPVRPELAAHLVGMRPAADFSIAAFRAGIDLLGQHHHQAHILVAARRRSCRPGRRGRAGAVACRCWTPAGTLTETLPSMVGTLMRGAQHRLVERDRQLDQDVVAVAGEDRVRLHRHLDEGIAGRRAAAARQALALQAQGLAGVGAGRQLHVQRLAVGQLQALLGAEHRFQERHAHLIADIGALQLDRCRRGPCRSRRSRRTGRRRIRSSSTSKPKLRAAALLRRPPPGRTAGIARTRAAGRSRRSRRGRICAAWSAIAQEIVGGGGLLELRLDLLVAGIEVGVQLLGELAIGALDVLVARAARHAQDFVRIGHVTSPSCGQ